MIDGYILRILIFEAKLDLFYNHLMDYGESFPQVRDKRRDQGFLLHGQTVTFLHHFLRRNPQRVSLPQEDDWKSLKGFDFVKKELLSNEQVMVITTFKDRAVTVVKG